MTKEEAGHVCEHPWVTRDISNMTTCGVCGKELGIGYGINEYPPTGEYMGITRTGAILQETKP